MALKRDTNGWPLPPNGALSQWARFIITVLVIPVVVWGFTMERRVLSIEKTRWALADEVLFQTSLANAMNVLRVEMTRMRSDMDRKVDRDDAPPADYRKEVDRRFDELREQLNKLEERIR